jgi:PAS domain S-box-containing protein
MIQGVAVLAGLFVAIVLGLLCYRSNPASLTNYSVTLLNVVLAIFALAADPKRKLNRVFAIFALLVASWGADLTFLFLAPTEDMARIGVRFARLGLIYLFPCMIYFTMVFTRRESDRAPLNVALAWATGLAILSMVGAMDDGVKFNGVNWYPIPNVWYHMYSLLVLFSFGYSAFLSGYAWRRETQSRLRLQYAQFFFSILIMWSLGFINQIATYVSAFAPQLGVTPSLLQFSFFGALGGVLFFVVIAFGIVRNRWLDISFVIRRTLVYSTLTAGVAGVYGVSLVTFSSIFHGGEQSSFAASVLTITLVSFAFMPARDRLQQLIDRLFYRDAYDDRRMMQKMTETVARVLGNRQISETVLEALVPAMKIRKAQILLADKAFDKVFGEPVAEKQAHPGPIPSQPIDRTEPDPISSPLCEYLERECLELAFPILAKDQPIGLLMIGPKLSELPYRPEEFQILQTAAQQIGIAVENSRLYEQVLSMKIYNDNILRSMDDGLVTFDPEGRLISVNTSAQRILSLPGTGVPAEEAFQTLPELARIARETLMRGIGVQHVEISFGPEGERTLLVTSTPLQGQNGKAAGGLILFADITEKKELERRLERDRRLAMIGQLASQIAHEIRNPIGSMKLLIDSLPERRADPEFEKLFMDTVPSEIDRLNHLVGDLLDFARPLRLIRVPTDLVEIVETSLRLTRDLLQDIQVVRDFSPSPPVNADGEKLKQILLNLFKNAAQAMKGCARRELKIRIWAEEYPKLEISDTGVGMDERQIGKIFTPFYSTKADGTGLGLAIVHRIIEEHGWSIEVKSKPSVGTTFVLSLKN